MPRPIHFACASAMFLAFAAPAVAQEHRSQVVRYGDLDLDRPQGADTMIRRVENASENVCGVRSGPQPLQVRRNTRECTWETADNAVADLNHPVVTSRYLYGVSPEVIIEEPNDYSDPNQKGSQ